MDTLHCSEFRPFWLSWDKGLFDVAKGSISGQRILEWQDPNPSPVHSLRLATGEKHMGDWNIPRYEGNITLHKHRLSLRENRPLRTLKIWKESHKGIVKVMERSPLKDLS